MTKKITAEGEIIIQPFDPAALPLIKAMPLAKLNSKTKTWFVSTEVCHRRRVLDIADRLDLEIDPILLQLELSSQAEMAKERGAFAFQVEGVDWLSRCDSAILGDEMGLGKSGQAIFALPSNARVIVVAPASLKYNWQAEIQKWRPEFRSTILNGVDSFTFPEPNEIIITNYDILPTWLEPAARVELIAKAKRSKNVKIPKEYAAQLQNCYLIVDEAHKIKNEKSKRAKKINSLSRAVRSVWGLTGTPMLNKPSDLYGVLDALNMVEQTFKDWDTFVDLFSGYKSKTGSGMSWGLPDPIVPELLRNVMLRRLRKDVLPDLPEKIPSEYIVELNDRKLISILDETYENYESMLDMDKLPPFEDFSTIRAMLATSRIPAAMEFIDDCEEESEDGYCKLLVFSAHTEPIITIGEREGWAAITGDTPPKERQQIVNDFQSGKLRGVALTIQAGGVGLTLTNATRILFVDLDWNPANNLQAEDRIVRIGQGASSVEIIRMISNHPMDKHITRILNKKLALISATIESKIPYSESASRMQEISEILDMVNNPN